MKLVIGLCAEAVGRTVPAAAALVGSTMSTTSGRGPVIRSKARRTVPANSVSVNEDLGAAMIQDIGDGIGIQAGVDRR